MSYFPCWQGSWTPTNTPTLLHTHTNTLLQTHSHKHTHSMQVFFASWQVVEHTHKHTSFLFNSQQGVLTIHTYTFLDKYCKALPSCKTDKTRDEVSTFWALHAGRSCGHQRSCLADSANTLNSEIPDRQPHPGTQTSPDFGFPWQCFLHHRGSGRPRRRGRHFIVAAGLQAFHFTHKIVVAVKAAVEGVVETALFDQTLYIVARQGSADQAADARGAIQGRTAKDR